jgi:hypothetical protein
MKKDTPKDVLDIVCQYLVDNGYDGLCNDCFDGCGCETVDLCPCDNIQKDCVPGYNHPRLAERNKCGIWITPIKPRKARRA